MRNVNPVQFAKHGFLQEANRLFFHPLGLCLGITYQQDEWGNLYGGTFSVEDLLDDPEGVLFTETNPPEKQKAERVEAIRRAKAAVRMQRYSFEVQPIPEEAASVG